MNLVLLLCALFQLGSQGEATCAVGSIGSVKEVCYYVSPAEATWADAETACQLKGGSLAVVDEQDVQVFLSGYVEYTTRQNVIYQATANDYKYHYLHDLGLDVTNHKDVTFTVQACHDAHIALSSEKGLDTSDTYEIVLGGWSDTQSVIRDCKQCANMDEAKHNASTHPLSCTDFRPFWVSWGDQVIRVGTGNDVGENEFMSWKDPNPHSVNYVAVATGFGSSGNWSFDLQTYTPGKFWIGGQYVASEGDWMWLPKLAPRFIAFQHWANNEPDNANGNEQCLLMDMHTNMQWRDENCEARRNYVCQTPTLEAQLIG